MAFLPPYLKNGTTKRIKPAAFCRLKFCVRRGLLFQRERERDVAGWSDLSSLYSGCRRTVPHAVGVEGVWDPQREHLGSTRWLGHCQVLGRGPRVLKPQRRHLCISLVNFLSPTSALYVPPMKYRHPAARPRIPSAFSLEKGAASTPRQGAAALDIASFLCLNSKAGSRNGVTIS